MKRALPTLVAAFASVAANAAQAQDASPCGADHAAWLALHAEEMTGTWTDTPVMGLLVGQPMPLGPPEPVQMTAIPDGFSTVGEDPVRVYELVLTDGPFMVDPPGGAGALARLDRETITDCPIADLPRLASSYTIEIDGEMVEGNIAAVVQSTRVVHIWFALDTSFGRVEQMSTLTR